MCLCVHVCIMCTSVHIYAHDHPYACTFCVYMQTCTCFSNFVLLKVLSRAFRNRFVELHFDDIPAEELVTILYRRCKLPESYAKKLVAVMRELQVQYISKHIAILL